MQLASTIAKKMEGATWKLKLHFPFPDSLPVPVFHRILAESAVEFLRDVTIVTKNVKTKLVKFSQWKQIRIELCMYASITIQGNVLIKLYFSTWWKKSSFLISGFTSGSCFPPDFGGKCSGIPQRCENCDKKCENKACEIFSMKANPNWIYVYLIWNKFPVIKQSVKFWDYISNFRIHFRFPFSARFWWTMYVVESVRDVKIVTKKWKQLW